MILYIFGGVVLVAVACVLLALFGRNLFKPHLEARNTDVVERRWGDLLRLSDPHRRVLEADSLLDFAFTSMGFRGSMGDKLKKAGKYLKNEQDVWNAHKLRNRIAHESGIILSERDATRALDAFRKALDVFVR